MLKDTVACQPDQSTSVFFWNPIPAPSVCLPLASLHRLITSSSKSSTNHTLGELLSPTPTSYTPVAGKLPYPVYCLPCLPAWRASIAIVMCTTCSAKQKNWGDRCARFLPACLSACLFAACSLTITFLMGSGWMDNLLYTLVFTALACVHICVHAHIKFLITPTYLILFFSHSH